MRFVKLNLDPLQKWAYLVLSWHKVNSLATGRSTDAMRSNLKKAVSSDLLVSFAISYRDE